jgi:enoyl-CoA hydratase
MTAVRYELNDQIAEIVLDSAPVNALSVPMIDDVLAALARARDDAEARVVILRSALPGVFCAGLNLALLSEGDASLPRTLLERLYVRMTELQFHLGKPSIAAVNGPARAGGMTLAISCDMIVAGRSASFGYPEIDVGLIPAIHFTHLPRIVGRARAFDLLFTGRAFDAGEAAALGLVSRIVDDDVVLDEARKLARVLAAKPPGVMRMARTAFANANDNGYRQGVAAAVENFCNVMATDEAREGIRAFAQKRRPAWAPRRRA